MINVNLNTLVSLTNLTEHGRSIYTRHIKDANRILEKNGSTSRIKEENKIPLWEFMNIFGDSFWNGSKQVVTNNTIIFPQ